MIVTCERCATQFQLEDARIPAGGVRVRCSRCKHAFEIRLSEPGAPHEEEESDWEFNEEPPSGESDSGLSALGRDAATHVVDDLLGSAEPPPTQSAPSGSDESDFDHGAGSLDLRGDPEPPASDSIPLAGEDEAPTTVREPETPSAPLSAEPGRPEGAAGPEPEPEPDLDIGDGEDLDLSADGLGGEDLDASDLELETAGDPAAQPTPASPPRDELGNPEHWDDFGERDGEGMSLGASPAGPGFEVDPDELIDDQPRWLSFLGQASGAAGWVLVIALFGFGLSGALRAPAVAAVSPEIAAPGVALAEISGRWVDHLEAGPIYVVSGRLQAERGGSVPSLALEFTGETGQVLSPPIPLRVPHAPAELRETPLALLAQGSDLRTARRRMRPGEKRSFEAVVTGLPAGARGLRLIEVEAPAPPAPVAPEPVAVRDPASEPSAAVTDPALDPRAPESASPAAADQPPVAPPAAATP